MKILFTMRALMHIPHGIIFMHLLLLPPPTVGIAAAVVFAYFFYRYELNQDMHLKDGAWHDLVGFMEGIVLGAPVYYFVQPLV
jgi:hypothetical protein